MSQAEINLHSDQASEISSTQLSTRYPYVASSELIGFVAGASIESEQVLPSHSAESLSRALATIPLYTRTCATPRSDTLSKAQNIALETRVTLKQSVLTAANIGLAISQLIRTLHNSDSAVSGLPRSAQDEANKALTLAREALRSLSVTKRNVSEVSSTLEAELSASVDSRAERWKPALRLTILLAAGPSFVTGVLSSAYNSSSPALSLAFGVTSATIGVMGSVGPIAAQWYLERKDRGPRREDLQGVYIESSRLVYPLFLVHEWWKQIIHLMNIKHFGSVASYAIKMCEKILRQISQYTKEITSILNSVEHLGFVEDVRRTGNSLV